MARILVAGGSLGGLMAACLLGRASHEVTVLERTAGTMDGRGAGIVTHASLVEGLRRCGMPDGYELGVAIPGRITLDSAGAVLGELRMPQVLTSWSRLYQLLHGLFMQTGRGRYHQGVTVQHVAQDAAGVRVATTGGDFEGDLLVGADGIRSAVRRQFWPEVQPEYAGYVAWRGLCDESVLSRGGREAVFERFGFCLPPGEQLIGYPVAGPGNRTDPGHRAWNFVWYRAAAEPEQLAALMTDADGEHHPQGIAPNKVSWRAIAAMRSDARRLLAPAFAEIVEKCPQPFLQPIHDLFSSELVAGRVALLGDAAFVARPHVGMGVTKAMHDALALESSLGTSADAAAALRAYSEARRDPSQQVVLRGRRLGAYMQASGQKGALTSRDVASVMGDTAVE